MQNELTVRISGEAGQGMQTIGSALCKVFKKAGYHIFANQDYMSRIRGGNNFFQIRVGERPFYTLREKPDITVALDKASITLGPENFLFNVPIYDMAKKTGGGEIFVNSVACGVILGVMKIDFSFLSEVLREAFSDKGEEIIKKNIDCAGEGFNFASQNCPPDIPVCGGIKLKGTGGERLLMNGNEALALGAIRAGCKFYSAYPMTPSTGIMNTIAEYAKDFNIVVEQAEDEIAAVNMIIGASFAGIRSMTGTSGGGFCLMVEGLSLAGMTETPIVVADAQRPAPATGFPTRTEQADLEFLLHAGHGEFARAVFSPGSIEEAFYLVIKAFNLAEKYQIPVLIMTDQHLADSYRDIEMLDYDKVKIQRYIISRSAGSYKRYQFTETGISPRAIPGRIEDVIYADSDEHTEEGHITEDAEIRKKMVEKRFYKKMLGLSQEVEKPTVYNAKDADIILLGFGSTYGVMKEVCESVNTKKLGFIHLSQVWPLPIAHLVELFEESKKLITVENNAGAQLARLIMGETGVKIDRSILKYDGRPFNLDYLTREVLKEAEYAETRGFQEQ